LIKDACTKESWRHGLDKTGWERNSKSRLAAYLIAADNYNSPMFEKLMGWA